MSRTDSRSIALRTAVLFALVACITVACRQAAPGDPPRLVVLYAPCTVNRDYLTPYNETANYTPALARLAREGVVFERHWTESGQSGIAFASIFSGTQAPGHQVYSHPTLIDESVYLVTEAFAAAGYENFFWGGHGLASGKYGYAQGRRTAKRLCEAAAGR